MKVLITAGGTSEKIDSVRAITNFSSGKTGAFLARRFSECSHQVTCLISSTSHSQRLPSGIESITFEGALDLRMKLKSLLSENNFDTVIHSAAVSDYRPVQANCMGNVFELPYTGKLNSNANTLSIEFEKNPKIINEIKEMSQNPNIIIFGFKLTDALSRQDEVRAVDKIFSEAMVDYIIHNDLSAVSEFQHSYKIYTSVSSIHTGETKESMFMNINQIINKRGAL